MSKDEKSFTETKLVNTLKKLWIFRICWLFTFWEVPLTQVKHARNYWFLKVSTRIFLCLYVKYYFKLWSTATHFSLQHLRDCTSCFQMRQDELFYFSFLQKLHLMLKKSPTKHNEKPQQNPTHHICFTGPLYKTNLFSDDSFCCDDFTVVTITDFLIWTKLFYSSQICSPSYPAERCRIVTYSHEKEKCKQNDVWFVDSGFCCLLAAAVV